MSALDKVPQNLNQLSKLSFRMAVKRLPTVNFFLQTVEMPDVSLPAIDTLTPLSTIPWPSGRIDFGTLVVTFKVDSDFKNYIELWNWIKGLGHPDDLSEYKELADKPQWTGEGIFSDVSLMILSNIKNANIEVIYEGALPIYLSGIDFGSNLPSVEYATATARFKYNVFKILPLPESP